MPPHTMRKRSITLAGHRTSVALENAYWSEVERMARARKISLQALVSAVDARRPADIGLASALRLAVLEDLKSASVAGATLSDAPPGDAGQTDAGRTSAGETSAGETSAGIGDVGIGSAGMSDADQVGADRGGANQRAASQWDVSEWDAGKGEQE